MPPIQEVILKEGRAPKPDPKPASQSSTSTPMPPHTSKKRSPKKTDGPLLSGRRTTLKSPAKRKKKQSPQKRKKPDTQYDHLDTDSDDDDDNEDEGLTQTKPPFIIIFVIDLGMWGFAYGRASSDTEPIYVIANSTWPDSQSNQVKCPSMVAFKKDNPKHPAFRRVKDHLVGFKVAPDMVKCAFFKASLDQRAPATKFDNPILKRPIAERLVSFSSPNKDEQAARAVLKYIYDQEIKSAAGAQIGFEDNTLEDTKYIFVLTHPAACSKAGRDKLEEIAKAAGLGSRHGDEVKLLSEAQAAAMAAFISYQKVVKHAAWKVYFKVGEWITILDIGSLTVDTTTEEIVSNDPRVQLSEKIVSEGGRCGTVTFHLHLLEFIQKKFALTAEDLPQTLVGRGTPFHDECEAVMRTFTGNVADGATNLPLRLPGAVTHEDYDAEFGEITLQIRELKKVFDEWLVFPVNIMMDQWKKSEEKSHKVKTTIVCGGGSLMPYAWTRISDICKEHGVKGVRPERAIEAVCRGAIISELSDGLIGQRLCRAHFGIKLEVDGEIQMRWVIKRGDPVDTTKPKMLENVAGHFTLSIEDVINQAAKFELKIFSYDKDDREVTDPEDAGIEEIAAIILDKSNMSAYLQNKLIDRLRDLDDEGRKKSNLDVEVLLGIDESGRLYFEAKAGTASLGKKVLRYDFTRR